MFSFFVKSIHKLEKNNNYFLPLFFIPLDQFLIFLANSKVWIKGTCPPLYTEALQCVFVHLWDVIPRCSSALCLPELIRQILGTEDRSAQP